MNIIISSFPGERRLQSVFVPLFLGSTRAIYHANSTEYPFEALTQTYTYNKRHGGRKQRTLRDSLGLLTRTGFAAEVQPIIQQRKQNCQHQEAPNRIQQAAGSGGGDSLLERSSAPIPLPRLLCTYCDGLYTLHVCKLRTVVRDTLTAQR